MINADPRATSVFLKDVDDTYAHIVERVRVAEEEEAAAGEARGEQIQLVPENPDATIGFNVPDGPPPEHITLEGPGTEDMDIGEVRKALQMQWDVFDGFSVELKEALKSQSLEAVNKVLGSMKVTEAENVVTLLQVSGILNFADGGIRDETGKAEDTEGVEDEEEYKDEE
jgi:cell division cycle protein 37